MSGTFLWLFRLSYSARKKYDHPTGLKDIKIVRTIGPGILFGQIRLDFEQPYNVLLGSFVGFIPANLHARAPIEIHFRITMAALVSTPHHLTSIKAYKHKKGDIKE